ncbi:MAG: MFS transporter [Ilumatobacteraceae bacterium]|nr:MFS transporter [Ilumatobacteraceae bacterium]
MGRNGVHLVREWPDETQVRAWLCTPRDDLVGEEPDLDDSDTVASFSQRHGPFRDYRRTVSARDGRLHERTDYRLVIPWFRWLFGPLVKRSLSRRAPDSRGGQPGWAPPDRLDQRQVRILGLLAAASLLTAFVNTLFTQTVSFAGDDFGVGDWGRGVAGTIVRVGVLFGLPAALLADRIGRRRVVVTLAWAAPIIASLGALAPNFPVLVATQALGRPLGLALDLLIAVIAAEEMPRGSRAYAISVLAMANGLGAGVAVVALPLADVGQSGWRWVYVLGLVWLLVARDLARHLPETKRFEWHRADVAATPVPRLQRRRLGIQMAVAFFGNMLLSPASFFQNTFLKDERGFSAGMVSLFTIVTATPAVIGLVVGGRVADRSGRRRLAVICAPTGALLIAASFSFSGPLMWWSAIIGAIVAAAAYPPLAVYRTELFPTGNRGRAAYLILASALLGGSISLLLTGAIVDGGTPYGPVMLALVGGPVVVALIVAFTYPETARRELEELNPEDHTMPVSRASDSTE